MPARGARWGALIVAAMALAGCGGSSTKRATPTAAPEPPATIQVAKGRPIKIGVSVALSGDQQALGMDLADAVELAVRDRGAALRGHSVTAVRMDDGCADAQKAVGVARSLAGDAAVAGVIGPMCTTGAQAADSVYEAAHMVHILPAATRADLSAQGEQYFFRTAWIDDAQSQAQATYALGRGGARSVMVVDDAEPYGRALGDGFEAAFQAGGGTVTSRERIKRGDTEFGTLVRKVSTANPDAVVFEGLNPEAPLLVQALRKDGYAGLFLAPDGVLSARDFVDSLRDSSGNSPAEGAVVTGGPTPDDAFVAKFQQAFQRAPGTPFVLQAYDAATALLKAIEAVATEGSDGTLVIDRAGLADKLRTQGSEGMTGTLRFDEHGDRAGETPRELGLAVYKVVDGRFQIQ